MTQVSPQYRAWRSNQVSSWLRSNFYICLATSILVIGACLSVVFSGCGVRILSFTMQSGGLVLSVGALVLTARENRVPTPWQAIKEWFDRALNLFRDQPQVSGEVNATFPRFEGFAFGGASFPSNQMSVDEKFDWLLGLINGQLKTMAQESLTVNSKLEELGKGIQSTQAIVQQYQIEVAEKIRGVSVGSFYQVVFGLLLLSAGSILSLFIDFPHL